MSDYPFEEVFPFADTAQADEIMPLYNFVEAELVPGTQPVTVADYRAKFDRPNMEFRHFVSRDNAGVVEGLVIPMRWTDGSNDHFQWVQVLVRADSRRRGIGSSLLKKAHAVAVEFGQTTMSADAFESFPASTGFAESVGATVAIREYINVVEVVDLDIEMLERWRAEVPVRAQDYEMLVWDDGYPAEHHASIAALWVMADEDMPYEDLDLNPPTETAQSVCKVVEARIGLTESVTAVARHKESGALAGWSELLRRNSDKLKLETTLTMVHRDHRSHALGKWVKAEVILRGLERWPSGVRITTENAMSNAPMLGINNAIGFKPKDALLGYQASTETVAAYLNNV